MFAFLMTPLGRRIAIGGGILILSLGALRLWGNRQYAIGREDEKASSSKMLAEMATKARDDARNELMAEREALAADRTALDQSRAQFLADRRQVDTQLQARLNTIATAARQGTNVVSQTPDDGINNLVRTLLADLRTSPAQ